MICFHELILNTDLSQIRIKGLSMFCIKFENYIICDVIKQNESELADIDFLVGAIIVSISLVFYCFERH